MNKAPALDDVNKAPALADLNKAPYLDVARDLRILYVNKSPALDGVNETPPWMGTRMLLDNPGGP